MTLELLSPCKVNLLLNILNKRADGFHELETVMQPVAFHDTLRFKRGGSGLALTCSDPTLPTDSRNLVFRAAERFLNRYKIGDGLRIHLEKRIPHAAGLGGGSGNAATTLSGLNEMFSNPATPAELVEMAAALGSDIPFFLQKGPALATGRGEKIEPLAPFPALKGTYILLVHPGFGISTPWAYQQLSRFPKALHGERGRAAKLISNLQREETAGAGFYNSLEAPALGKYPLLAIIQEFFRENGALASIMSGSGSATFAWIANQKAGDDLVESFKTKFGAKFWTALVPL